MHHPDDYLSYKSCLVDFMSYNNKINYPKDWEFSVKELSPLTPEMICR